MSSSYGNGHHPNGRGEIPDAVKVGAALWAFANATTWDEALRILERQQDLLLSDMALAALFLLIADLRSSGSPDDAREAQYWEVHLALLEDARAHGVAIVLEQARRDLEASPRVGAQPPRESLCTTQQSGIRYGHRGGYSYRRHRPRRRRPR